MDSSNFDWLDNDKSMSESLVASTPVQSSNTSNEILHYLLQDATTNFSPSNIQPMSFQPNQMIEPVNKKSKPLLNESKSIVRTTEFNSSLSVVQQEDNFVTFMPVNNTIRTKKPSVPKKSKMKDSIFVTELPQNAYKKKKKSSDQLSSGEENSDDDMLLDEQFPASKLKNMTPKERRQLRNKISARNFRVRRKEYITQLEEKVEQHENTIEELQQENSKLRLANDELMKQLLNQPLTPPSSDNVLSSSGSEGNYSPDAGPVPTMFQFQFNDLYDLNLFDQTQPQETTTDTSNLFYLNHAVMPDWDIHQVLGEKGRPMLPEIDQRQAARNLIHDYPLLVPALMSIVVRHTLSLEYVTSIAKEFSDSLGAEFAEQASEEKLQKMETLQIEGPINSKDLCEEDITDAEFIRLVMKYYFPSYLLLRARGISHDETIERFKYCYKESPTCFKKHKDAMLKKKKEASQKTSKACKSSHSSKLSTLHTYCKVAGTLLKHPTRMAHVNQVLKKEISFTSNKHTARIENQYVSMINPFKNLRIVNSSQ